MTHSSKLLLLAGLSFLVLSGCVGPYSTSGRVVVQDEHGMVDIVFSDHDRALIRGYYGGAHKTKQKQIPPGLAKKSKRPPGLQKQLVRRGQLPPGLEYHRLPHDLEQRLTHIPGDYLRVAIGGSFVLFNQHTKMIFDVMHDFCPSPCTIWISIVDLNPKSLRTKVVTWRDVGWPLLFSLLFS